MFSNHLIEYAEERYEERLELLWMWRERVAGRMAQCGWRSRFDEVSMDDAPSGCRGV
ncbi:MAG: hypothetical protein ACLTC4_18625 [Hungatella hathewayi]